MRLLWAAVVVVAAVAPYLQTLSADLVWDDRMLISEELRFYAPDYLQQAFTGDFFGSTEEMFKYGYYRPLVSLSYYLTWRAAGDAAMPYHLTNVLLHVGVSLLVVLLGWSLFPGRFAVGGAAAMLFAVHPVHTESVAWVAGRTDLICALGIVVSLIGLNRLLPPGRARGSGGMTQAGAWGFLTVGFAGAVLAKEMALLLPVATVLGALGLATNATQRRRWWSVTGVLAAVTAAYLILRLTVANVGTTSDQWRLDQLPSVVVTFLATFARYLGELIAPLRAEPYVLNPLRSCGEACTDPLVWVGALALAAAVWWCFRLRRLEQRADAWLLALGVVSFAPISNVVRITAPSDMGAPMAERFLYVPSIFFCLLAARAAVGLWRRMNGPGARVTLVTIGAVVVTTAGIQSALASKVWSDETTLFSTMMEQAPDAQLPRTLLGTMYRREGRYREAVSSLEAALARIPDPHAPARLTVYNNLAGAVAALGDRERARHLLEQAATFGQGSVSVLNNLAVLERLDGNLTAAEQALDGALTEEPWHDQALAQRGQVRLARGAVDGAVDDLERYLERYPPTFEVLVALADATGQRGQRLRARSLLEQAAGLRPGAPEAAIPLGRLAIAESRWRDARRAFESVLSRSPEHVPALNGAAIAAARMSDTASARALLERAEAVAPADPSTVLNLARLDLEAGDRERAQARIMDALVSQPDHPQLRGALEQLGSRP